MSKSRNFIERQTFNVAMSEVRRKDGKHYEDIDTIYGDMSRLVVAWLAKTPPNAIHALYNELGWKGEANAVPIRELPDSWFRLVIESPRNY